MTAQMRTWSRSAWATVSVGLVLMECDPSTVWRRASVTEVLSDLSASSAALALEQWLHHSISPADVCREFEVCQHWCSSQFITPSSSSPESPLHHLLQPWAWAKRVREDTSHWSSAFFFYSDLWFILCFPCLCFAVIFPMPPFQFHLTLWWAAFSTRVPCSDLIACNFANEIAIKRVYRLKPVSCVRPPYRLHKHSMFLFLFFLLLFWARLRVPFCDVSQRCRWMCGMKFSLLATAAPHWWSLPPSLFSTVSTLNIFFSFFFSYIPSSSSSFCCFSSSLSSHSHREWRQHRKVLLFLAFWQAHRLTSRERVIRGKVC